MARRRDPERSKAESKGEPERPKADQTIGRSDDRTMRSRARPTPAFDLLIVSFSDLLILHSCSKASLFAIYTYYDALSNRCDVTGRWKMRILVVRKQRW